jgi:hypothetical protein
MLTWWVLISSQIIDKQTKNGFSLTIQVNNDMDSLETLNTA